PASTSLEESESVPAADAKPEPEAEVDELSGTGSSFQLRGGSSESGMSLLQWRGGFTGRTSLPSYENSGPRGRSICRDFPAKWRGAFKRTDGRLSGGRAD